MHLSPVAVEAAIRLLDDRAVPPFSGAGVDGIGEILEAAGK
jgi:hypothetical protein